MTSDRLAHLRSLLERVERAEGPDRELDLAICRLFPALDYLGHAAGLPDEDFLREFPPVSFPRFSASIDAAVSLINRVLPGWFWRVASCHLSDDAWVAPDYNDPAHGERLLRDFPQTAVPDWIEITDVDRRPAGQPALALLTALFRALIAKEEGNAQGE